VFFALDLVSLLLSKENPTVASMTLRGELQNMVGLGKLGTQKHDQSALTPERSKELFAITNGWNVLAIDDVKNSTTAAASALEIEVDKEAKYWEDVLSIREGGWSMCRMPRERQTLGVRFGFNEGKGLVTREIIPVS
jgi:mediator of RNA polymerase II transcription subunit 17